MANLFKPKPQLTDTFEKAASLSIQLANPPEDWESEITDYAYRLHPWLVDFTIAIEFLKKLPDRQYGIGSILVSAKQPISPERQLGSAFQQGPQSQGAEQEVMASIPLIIAEGTLAPLDIFISGSTVCTLDEDNFKRKAGELTQMGKYTGRISSDPTLIGYLWPPSRTFFFGSGGMDMGSAMMGGVKLAEDSRLDDAKFFYKAQRLGVEELEMLSDFTGVPFSDRFSKGAAYVNPQKVKILQEKVAQEPGLADILGPLIEALAGTSSGVPPVRGPVVQVLQGVDGATVRATDPTGFSFTRRASIDIPGGTDIGNGMFCSLKPTATIKSSNATTVKFEYPAVCAATLQDGQDQKVGFLVSTVVDLDGNPTGKSLFVDAKRQSWAMESTLYCSVGRELQDMKGGVPQGTGFFLAEGEKGLVAMVPMTVRSIAKAKEGTCYFCTVHESGVASRGFPMDTSLKVYVAQGLRSPIYSPETQVLTLPAFFKWVPLGDTRFRPFAPLRVDPTVKVMKLASNLFALEGQAVSSIVTEPLDSDDTALVLLATGVPANQVETVLDKVADEGLVELTGCRTLVPRGKVSVEIPWVDIEFLKAAAMLDDPNSVDAVLGLGLLDTEIENDYNSMAQDLERAQQKVARLLLLSRLGMHEIPEGPAKVVMTRMQPIIDSLRAISLQGLYR